MTFYTLDEVLRRHKDDFIKDFDVRDIRFQPTFLHMEIESIISEPKENQFEKLCFIVKYQKPQTIRFRDEFVNCLRTDYDWLVERMSVTIGQEEGDGDKAIEEYRSSLFTSDIPRTGDLFVYRLPLVS